MSTEQHNRTKGEVLLEIRGLRIEGLSDDDWHEIVKGIDLTLQRGEVLGLIGESGAGKSTLGLAAMGFARPGCRISGGPIVLRRHRSHAGRRRRQRKLRGSRIAYVAQSAAAVLQSRRTGCIDQTVETALDHHILDREPRPKPMRVDLYRPVAPAQSRARSAIAIRTRSRAASCSAP